MCAFRQKPKCDKKCYEGTMGIHFSLQRADGWCESAVVYDQSPA